MTFTKETAAEMGRKGGQKRGRKAPRNDSSLTLEQVKAELPPLDSYENAQTRLARASDWVACGVMNGTQGHAFARMHEVWLRAAEARLSAELVDDVTERVKELEGQLKKQRMGVVR